MTRALSIAAALLLAGCAMTPLGPGPVAPPTPEPGPAATPCERAAVQYQRVCPGRASSADFITQCRSFEELGGAYSWDARCMEQATDCDALQQCRGGR